MIPSLPALEAGLRRPAAGTSRATEAGLDAGRRVVSTGREAGAVVPAEALATETLADDTRLAASLAAGAGRILLDLRDRAGRDGIPFDGPELGRAGDAAAQAWLAAALRDARPQDAVLSEEGERDDGRLAAQRVWIVDPLDGTREFAECDADAVRRTDFAVHVALWVRGRGLTAGAVGLPARNRVLDTDSITSMPAPPAAARLRIAVSRTRPPAIAQRLAERDDVELVGFGSVGVKVVAVLDGEADAYVHAGGQYEWDSAAPVAVARAAGLVATRLNGSPLDWNRPDPWQPDLFVCQPAVEARLRALLDGAGA
jgi:3'(2'), 5'-bisphosphate nucleotidase